MTREEIDTLWQRALHDAVKEDEQFTRYHFAAMVLEAAAVKTEEAWFIDGTFTAQEFAMLVRAMKPAKEQT